MSNEKNTLLVRTAEESGVRRAGVIPRAKELEVEVLAQNVESFMIKVEQILEKTPEEVGKGKFRLTEFTISAEITGKGELALLGTGVEVGAQGGLTFKFERK
jgi:phage gp29-like protein